MSAPGRVSLILAVAVVTLSGFTRALQAQGTPNVSPDGGAILISPNATNQTVSFTVSGLNSGFSYTFEWYCYGAVVSCSSPNGSSTPSPGHPINWDLKINTNSGQSGRLVLKAFGGGSSDTGWYNVTVGVQEPTVSLAPYSSGVRPVDPFDLSQLVTTPAYVSVEQPRSVTLFYNSSTVRPTPAIVLDVSTPPAPFNPTVYSVQVKRTSNQTLLKLLNDTTIVYYSAPTTLVNSRLVAALDAKANGLGTGWYDVSVIVTAYYGGVGKVTTVSSRLLVEDESTSLFGAGWKIAGLQRLYTMPNDWGVMISNGDGSMSYFSRACQTCAFASPAGDPTTVGVYSGPDTGIAYRRRAPDSSAADFRSDGAMVRLWSGELYRPGVLLNWSGNQLTSIQDLIGKRFTLGYTGPASQSGKLQTITDPSGRIMTLWTDSLGKLYRVTDPDSLVTTFAYDTLLRLTGVTDRAGTTTNFTYDVLNRIDTTKAATITDYTGSAVRPAAIAVSPLRLAWQPSIAGKTSSSPKQQVLADTVSAKLTDPVGTVSRVAFDRFAGPIRTVDPFGKITTIQRDTLGQITSVTDPNGHTSTATYTGYNLASRHDNQTGQTVTYGYNGFNRVNTITGNGKVARTDIYYRQAYSGSGDFGPVDSVYVGNTGTHASPSGGYLIAWYQYNWFGQDSVITDGAGHRITAVYSDTAHFSNLIQATDPFARLSTQAHYDAVGRPDTVWAPYKGSLVSTVFSYDVMNRTRTIKDPLGFTTQFLYGPVLVDRIIDAKGQVHRFDYNALAWSTLQRDLADSTKADTLKYDAGGRVPVIKTRRGDAITLTYDAAGRILTRSGPDFPADTFRYDPSGLWRVAVNANAYDSLSYDVKGRLVYSRERLIGDTSYILTFTYDTLGRLTNRSAPTGGNVVTYSYNATSGTLDTLCAAGQCTVWSARDADYIPHTTKFGAKMATPWQQTVAIDSAHRVVSDSFQGTGVSHLNTEFAKKWYYDTLGHVIDEWPYGSQYGYGGFRYYYDADGRLTNGCADRTTYVQPIGVVFSCLDEYGEDTDQGPVLPYRYDSTGNRTDSLKAAIVGAGNRVSQFKGYGITYDLNGDIVAKNGLGGSGPTDTTLYSWDALGMLTRVERWNAGSGHTIVSYSYDALGRRVSKNVGGTIERYVHDGDRVIADINGATHALKVEYGWGPGSGEGLMYVRTPTWTAAVIPDPVNGTVRGLAKADGGQTFKLYPASYWGELSADTGFIMRFRHAGREYDAEAMLYYNRARYYDPLLGRFLSEDPMGEDAGINQYTYVGNDPVNRLDPLGLDDCQPPPPPPACTSNCIPVSAAVPGPAASAAGGDPGPCPDNPEPPNPNCMGNCGPQEHGGGCVQRDASGHCPTTQSNQVPVPSGPCIFSTAGGTVIADRSVVDKLRPFINAGVRATGTSVVSSFRTSGHQAAMWYDFNYGGNKGGYKAVGKRSCHQAGFCVDLNWSSLSPDQQATLDWLGFLFNFKRLESDRGHYYYSPNSGLGPGKGKDASYGPYADIKTAIGGAQGAYRRHEIHMCQ
jgi:RHS repeat-associated protein